MRRAFKCKINSSPYYLPSMKDRRRRSFSSYEKRKNLYLYLSNRFRSFSFGREFAIIRIVIPVLSYFRIAMTRLSRFFSFLAL